MAQPREERTVIHTRAKGNLGEDIACKYLANKGYIIVSRNYRRLWGELDIVAEKDNCLQFFEVKCLFVKDFTATSHVPEENVHMLKRRNIGRMIQTYLIDEKREGMDFKFHVLSILADPTSRIARVRMISDIIV